MQKYIGLLTFIVLLSCHQKTETIDVLIIGGGASGTSAAIQAARLDAKVLLIEETAWLGGMLTSAGVSAIDGNNNLPSGIWGEFRDSLVQHYGSRDALETGWVSNTLFEPQVGERIWSNITGQLSNLEVRRNTSLGTIQKNKDHWAAILSDGSKVRSKIVIDATELGDVSALVGIPHDIGMQDGESEPLGPQASNDIIQDLTYVAILKEYKEGNKHLLPKPSNYDPEEFSCACKTETNPIKAVDCQTMLNYGRLPNDYFMINWPNCGNDYYLNLIEDSQEERERKLEEAKEMTRKFVYYIQNDLGFQNLGIADDIFPTEDHFPLIPYHRESRRIKGKVRLLAEHLRDPYAQTYYRTGIAVGDYPIDHHHDKNDDAPEIDFIGIKVPSYSLPLGTLIPLEVENFITAEKSISVSNIVNGTTRLQPVVLGIGQAAGAIAALSALDDLTPAEVSIRSVQKVLLEHNAYLQPFIDVKPEDPDFGVIQKAGATGFLRGEGIPYKWANQTWFYPDTTMLASELANNSKDYCHIKEGTEGDSLVTISSIAIAMEPCLENFNLDSARDLLNVENVDKPLSKRQIATLIDHFTDFFDRPINFQGKLIGS